MSRQLMREGLFGEEQPQPPTLRRLDTGEKSELEFMDLASELLIAAPGDRAGILRRLLNMVDHDQD